MTDYLSVEVDDEYEGKADYGTSDCRVANITPVATFHNVNPAKLVSCIVVKIFEQEATERMVRMDDCHNLEHLVARAIVMAGISLVPVIRQYEGPTSEDLISA